MVRNLYTCPKVYLSVQSGLNQFKYVNNKFSLSSLWSGFIPQRPVVSIMVWTTYTQAPFTHTICHWAPMLGAANQPTNRTSTTSTSTDRYPHQWVPSYWSLMPLTLLPLYTQASSSLTTIKLRHGGNFPGAAITISLSVLSGTTNDKVSLSPASNHSPRKSTSITSNWIILLTSTRSPTSPCWCPRGNHPWIIQLRWG